MNNTAEWDRLSAPAEPVCDILFLLKPGFRDPAYGGEAQAADQAYYCPYCVALEGLLAAYPHLARVVTVERLPFPRPRPAVIEWLGEEHQSLPKLVLAADAPDRLATGRHGSVRFVDGHQAILRALSERHAVPYRTSERSPGRARKVRGLILGALLGPRRAAGRARLRHDRGPP